MDQTFFRKLYYMRARGLNGNQFRSPETLCWQHIYDVIILLKKTLFTLILKQIVFHLSNCPFLDIRYIWWQPLLQPFHFNDARSVGVAYFCYCLFRFYNIFAITKLLWNFMKWKSGLVDLCWNVFMKSLLAPKIT